jgi:DNA-binding response OmpR family regulator
MASQFAPKRILVVDDNRDAADLTAQLLELHGHQTLVAYGGKQGVEIALTFDPDVLLLDLGMPEMDGYAVACALRKVRSLDHVVVIAYTAWGDPETRQRVRESGFDGHTVKPAKFDVLLNMVSNTRRAS